MLFPPSRPAEELKHQRLVGTAIRLGPQVRSYAMAMVRGVMGAPRPLSRDFPSRSGCAGGTDHCHLEQIARAEEIIDGHLAAFLYKLDPSLGR